MASSQARLLPTLILYCTMMGRIQFKKKKKKKNRLGACQKPKPIFHGDSCRLIDFPIGQAGNSLSHFESGWVRLAIRLLSLKSDVYRTYVGLGWPLSYDSWHGAKVCKTSRESGAIFGAAILHPRWLHRKWRHPRPGVGFFTPSRLGWNMVTLLPAAILDLWNQKWDYPRWRQETKVLPFSTSQWDRKNAITTYESYYFQT